MATWVTGAQILAHAGIAAPSAEDSAWADVCASAVNAALDHRMTGVTVVAPADFPELEHAARGAGVEAYKRREAVFGLTGYADIEGAAIRVARDYLEAYGPQIARYATRGIG